MTGNAITAGRTAILRKTLHNRRRPRKGCTPLPPHILRGHTDTRRGQPTASSRKSSGPPVPRNGTEIDENLQDRAGNRDPEHEKSRNRCLINLLLAAITLAVTHEIIAGIARPNQVFASMRYSLGRVLGAFIFIYLISLLFFPIVRLIRGGTTPSAGLGIGIATALLLFASASHDDANSVIQHFAAAYVDNAA